MHVEIEFSFQVSHGAQWEDWLADGLHPLNDWKNYKRPKVAS